jgi:hypothetical protein
VLVWKQQLNGKTQNTNYTVDELIKIRKLFVWRGKNSENEEFTKDSVRNDGNQFTLNPSRDGYNKDDGLMSVVHESGKKMFGADGNVHVYDRIKSNDKTRDTGRTIEQLIKDGDLFVCDEIIESKGSYKDEPYDRTRQQWGGGGGGGTRKKSRKPKRRNSRSKRRNSRSNRTLNKSKK